MAMSKEEREARKRKAVLNELRKGPDLEKYLEGRRRKYTTYARGAKLYSMHYYAFVNLAKEAGANIRIKKKVVIDLDILERYIGEHGKEEGERDVQKTY